MYKFRMIIADDNTITANGLCDMIEATFSNIEVVNVCSNGKQVIDYLKNNIVDIIITDVQMPGKNGIDILKYIYDNHLNTKTILITGYTRFEYALDAIKYQVNSMLTKPINHALMIETIEKIIGEFKQELDNAYSQTTNVLKRFRIAKNNIKMVYYGVLSPIDNEIFELFSGEESISKQECALIEFSFSGSSKKTINTVWADLFEDANPDFDSYCIYEEEKMAKVFLMLKPLDILEPEKIVNKYINDCIEISKSAYGVSGEAKVIFSGKFSEYNAHSNFSEFIDNYCHYLDTSNITAKKECLNFLKSINLLTAQKFAFEFLNRFLSENDENYAEVKLNIKRSRQKSEIIEIINDIEKEYHKKKEGSDDLITKIKAYMIAHYDKDMTLNGIADIFKISPYYLSKLFKQKTSQNFSDYVISIKINKAKELLEKNEYSVEDIASAVGYSTDYFRRIFKSHCGISPNAYAKSSLKRML